MNWKRFSWFIAILLTVIVIWEIVYLNRAYQKMADIKSKSASDVGKQLVSLQRSIADQREYVESMEKVTLWASGAGPLSWLTRQANELNIQIIGVEHLPTEKVLGYEQVPLNITLRGDYNPLGRFINRLEHSPRAMKINSLRIRHKEQTPEQITMDMSLSYFRKVEEL